MPVKDPKNAYGIKALFRWYDKRLEKLIFGDINVGTN